MLQWAQETTRRGGQWRLQGFPASAARRGLLQFLHLALAALVDESRAKFELHFEVIVGSAEEPKKRARTTTSPKCTVSEQRSNDRRNEGERWRCVGQREKLDVKKAEQE